MVKKHTHANTLLSLIFSGGFKSQSFHTSTQDGQLRREDEEEEEAALFFPSIVPRRGADGARDWKHRLELANPGLMASCAGSAVQCECVRGWNFLTLHSWLAKVQ